MNYIKLLVTLSLCCLFSAAFAANNFLISNIQVKGLQRISENTVLSYLPIKKGDKFTRQMSDKIIKDLYATGFFSNVNLARSGNTLLINIDENPVISKIEIVGNKDLPKDKLNEALKKIGFVQGETFNNSTLEQVKQTLAEQYYLIGHYNTKVTAVIKQEDRKRVAIIINISPGLIAKVMKITLLGNKVFKQTTLVKEMQLAAPNLFSFFTKKDQYSKAKLDKSTVAIQHYYLNNGYLDMHIDSTQVTITPDKKYVYLVIHITEGEQYKFSGFKLTGNLILSEEELNKMIDIKIGKLFSRQTILNSINTITRKLGDKGYAFVKVNVLPKVAKDKRTVFITFDIDPGDRYYIRHINFSGNSHTSNIALRNSLTQFEGALYSISKIDESTRNLRQLRYLDPDQIIVKPMPVPNSTNQVDLDMQVTEKLSASFNLSFGYSTASGFIFQTGLMQDNFLGTGKTVGFEFSRTKLENAYSLNYFNPFFTYNGISRRMAAFYRASKPVVEKKDKKRITHLTNPLPGSDANPLAGNDTSYSISEAGFNDSFGFPISNYQSVNLGYGFQRTQLHIGNTPPSQISNFIQNYGTKFYQALITAGWSYNTFDRIQFPTRGSDQSLNLTISLPVNKANSLQYYTLSYQNRFYQPLVAGFIFNTYGIVGYGDGYGRYSTLPFLQNFFAGGLGTLGQNRAYLPNTLGPLDSNGDCFGGNLLLSGSAAIIFPTPLAKYNARTSVFMDVGNIFNTKKGPLQPASPPRLNNLRYSVGLQLEWLTPFGMPVVFSVSRTINQKPSDETQPFQFNIGASI